MLIRGGFSIRVGAWLLPRTWNIKVWVLVWQRLAGHLLCTRHWINSLGYNAEHDRDNCLSSQGWHSTGQCVLEVTPAYHQAFLYRVKVAYSNPQPRKGCSPQMVKGPLWPQPAQLWASLGWKWWEVEGVAGLKWTHWSCSQLCLSSWLCFYY